MRINLCTSTHLSNPFIKSVDKDKAKKLSFGNYFSVGADGLARGHKPAIRALAEKNLENTGSANKILSDVLLKLANDLKEKAYLMMQSDDKTLINEAKSLLAKASQLLKGIDDEIQAYMRRKEMSSKY